MIPITRIELFIDAIINGTTPPPPQTRIERYLGDIAAGRTASLTPKVRAECYLSKISGQQSVDVPVPQVRAEYWLAKKAGMSVATPTPITRLEYWLDEWINGGGGSHTATVTGTSPLTINAISAPIEALIQYGKCVQNGTPTPDAPVDIVCNNGTLVYDADSGAVRPSGTPEVLTITGANQLDYEPQTASVETLLGAGSHADEQDIISGEVTRRMCVYVVSGNEPLTLSSSGRVYFTDTGQVPNLNGLPNASFDAICTHFSYNTGRQVSSLADLQFLANGTGTPNKKNGRLAFRYDEVFTTVDAAQAWFRAQRAAGTPVIVVYTVKDATRESAAAQPLNTAAGRNTIAADAPISGVDMSVTYKTGG